MRQFSDNSHENPLASSAHTTEREQHKKRTRISGSAKAPHPKEAPRAAEATTAD
jgi:hypothetical protein